MNNAEKILLTTGILTISFVSIACDDTVSAPSQICFDDVLFANDVFGNGRYSEYLEQFKKETGCESALNCNASMKFRHCLDNVEFK